MTGGWKPSEELLEELAKSTEEIFRVVPVGQIEPDILDQMLLRTAVNFNRLKQEDQDNFFPVYAVLIEICTGVIMQNHKRSYLGPGYATYSWEEYEAHLEETRQLEEDLSYEDRLACEEYRELLQRTFLAVAKGHCKIQSSNAEEEWNTNTRSDTSPTGTPPQTTGSSSHTRTWSVFQFLAWIRSPRWWQKITSISEAAGKANGPRGSTPKSKE